MTIYLKNCLGMVWTPWRPVFSWTILKRIKIQHRTGLELIWFCRGDNEGIGDVGSVEEKMLSKLNSCLMQTRCIMWWSHFYVKARASYYENCHTSCLQNYPLHKLRPNSMLIFHFLVLQKCVSLLWLKG